MHFSGSENRSGFYHLILPETGVLPVLVKKSVLDCIGVWGSRTIPLEDKKTMENVDCTEPAEAKVKSRFFTDGAINVPHLCSERLINSSPSPIST